MAANKEDILVALEQLCRKDSLGQYSPLRRCDTDVQAVNWGPHAPEIARAVGKMTGALNTYQQTRRALQVLVAEGRALRASPHSRVVRYWPAGLCDQLKAEKAAAEQAVRDYKHDDTFAGAA